MLLHRIQISTAMSTDAASLPSPAGRARGWGSRGFWVRQIVSWHWITDAIALLGMIGFAATGITLNHAGDIAARPVVRQTKAALPAPLLAEVAGAATEGQNALPPRVAAWLDQRFAVNTGRRAAEWSAEEIYLTMTRPGGDAWISIDRGTGAITYEDSWRGWIAFFNDLHKGRNAGPYWTWFIDVFAGACIVFCLTGFGLLWLKAPARRVTWPLIGLGVLIPLVLAIFFIH